ncbi:MAG: GTP-binding protein Obg [uncultured Chthoniobacterales bacterium]|uniref:GTPase Obg n=1 Tax=uncultured Chthoniobacterales bacterium TaxID=1836801 RepID=A0A6J4I7X2_9BACT|nr:MAG: GTP-binding protein Obg [uncultured Chthoniobacterales bacterium]
MFVDRIKVFAQAGDGGSGCVSFRREKFVPRGGPDGGDGGRGGDVILRADVHTDNLTNLYYEPIVKAKSGTHGMGKKMSGKSALAKVVNVPIGTIVYRTAAPARRAAETDELHVATGEEEAEQPEGAVSDKTLPAPEDQIADLAADGQEFVLCAGGRGGKGNVHFKSAKNRAPIQFTEGTEGEQGHFLLELRTIADAALVGYPNAGKSTLLGKLSAAHPKVAPYPFTTLRPSVGVVELDEYRRATVADIPGLIEGAHRNVGLGHDFLRHITRCKFLLFVVDAAGSEGRHPVADIQSLRREIDLYDTRLSMRPWCIVANKMDLPESNENIAILRDRFAPVPVIPVSADRAEGIGDLKAHLADWLTVETNNAPAVESVAATASD